MKMYFVGTGAGGSPGSKRWRSATLFDLEDTLFLVDCGVGCHYRLSDKGLLTEIDAIFITHSHMDHFLGVPELLFQAHLEHRKKKLIIYAPKILERTIRAAAPHLYTTLGFEWEIKPIIPGETVMIGNKSSFTACKACHHTAEEAYGLVISAGELRIGYSGDTSQPCPELLGCFEKGIDILVHEATCNDEYAHICHQYGHTTTREAVDIGKKLGAKMVILNHIDEFFNSTVTRDLREIAGKACVNAFLPSDQDVIYIEQSMLRKQ